MVIRNRDKISLSGNGDISLQGAFDRFITYKKAMNLSDDTITYYNRCFKAFADFIGSDTKCNDITENDLVDYIVSLQESDLKDVTKNTHLRGVRAILYFCMEKEYTKAFKIKLLKVDKTIKETYTDDDLKKLLRKPNVKDSSFAEYRNWVIICFLLGTGARLRTFSNIKIKDIDFDHAEIMYTETKGRKQYIIPLTDSLSDILKEYLQYRKGSEEEYLFCNSYGEMLTRDTIVSAIKDYNTKRGVNKTSIHLFRHTFAKKWILNGGDIFRLQKILGHSTLEMVKEYVNMFGSDLKENFETFNPLENMKDRIKTKGSIKLDK